MRDENVQKQKWKRCMDVRRERDKDIKGIKKRKGAREKNTK
jgi:hypothetical protein